jgi:cellulose synthase/poly-beta-1,6-N-acetylglucosamine synthase-like glycosyltransferase
MSFYNEISSKMINSYIAANRPILDFIHMVFDNTFYVFLYITIGVSFLFMIMSIYAIFYKKSRKEYSFNESKTPFVTIQIPTFNELAALNCAQKCLEMDYPKDRYEIIIGDDSNRSEISEKIDEFASQHPDKIKVTRRESNIGFKPGNLNNMLKHTRGDIIVIFDSDFLPNKNFLRNVVAPFQHDSKIAGVQARWKFLNNDQNAYAFTGSLVGEAFHHVYLPFMKKIGKVSFLCGSGEAVRKDLLVKMGGWRSGSLTEDIEFSVRLLSEGYKIKYLEDVEVYCEAPFTAKDLYRQQKRWAYGVISSFISHFKNVVTSKKIDTKTKVFIHFQGIGYMFTMLLGLLFITGLISMVSHRPAPIEWMKFLSETGRNILLTSGSLVISLIALWRTRRLRHWWRVITTSLSIGLVMVYHVNEGIIKSILGGRMEWFMLKKLGNTKKMF